MSGLPAGLPSLKGVIYITVADWGECRGQWEGERWKRALGNRVKGERRVEIVRIIITLLLTIQAVSSLNHAGTL